MPAEVGGSRAPCSPRKNYGQQFFHERTVQIALSDIPVKLQYGTFDSEFIISTLGRRGQSAAACYPGTHIAGNVALMCPLTPVPRPANNKPANRLGGKLLKVLESATLVSLVRLRRVPVNYGYYDYDSRRLLVPPRRTRGERAVCISIYSPESSSRDSTMLNLTPERSRGSELVRTSFSRIIETLRVTLQEVVKQ